MIKLFSALLMSLWALLSLLLVACAEEPQPEIATRVVTVPVKQENVTMPLFNTGARRAQVTAAESRKQ